MKGLGLSFTKSNEKKLKIFLSLLALNLRNILYLHHQTKTKTAMKTQMTISEATQLIIDLCANHKDKGCRDEAIATLDDLGYFSDQDSRGNSRFIQSFTESSVRYHLKKVIESYS